MTVDVKYFFCNNKNLPQPTGMQLSKKYVTFSKFFARFRNLHLISNFLKKKRMTLIVYVFRKLQTPKNVVRQISKTPQFRTPFDSEALLVIYELLDCLSTDWLLMSSTLFEIVRTYRNHIKMELSKNERNFSEFSGPF